MYAHVNEAGEVDRHSIQPPRSMVLADGRTVSNPDPADVDRLAMGGWVEVTGEPPAYDPDLQTLTGPTFTVTTRQYVNDEGTYEVEVPVLDEDGNPTYDEATGEPITEVEQRPVADGQTYTVPDTVTATYELTDREVRLEVDRTQVPADGSVAATARYVHPGSGAPATVDFDVNGVITTEPLVDNKAVIEVLGSVAGPIVITAGGFTQTIQAV